MSYPRGDQDGILATMRAQPYAEGAFIPSLSGVRMYWLVMGVRAYLIQLAHQECGGTGPTVFPESETKDHLYL